MAINRRRNAGEDAEKIPSEMYRNTTTMEIKDSQKNKNLQTDPTILPFGIYCAELNFSRVDMKKHIHFRSSIHS